MLPGIECPSVADLRRFLVGDSTGLRAESLDQHVSECVRCQQALECLDGSDDILEVARSVRGKPQLEPSAEVETLIRRYARLSEIPSTEGEFEENGRADLERIAVSRFAPPLRDDEIGRLGPFRVLSVLGRGGMSVVFRAEDTRLSRPIALKILSPRLATKESGRQRFLREARAAANLRHHAIVAVHEVGHESDLNYLVYDLVDGPNLGMALKANAISFDQIAQWLADIAQALDYAHRQGILHRDVKPANILIDADRRVFLTDFGLAVRDDADSTLTQEGDLLGTPAYMSPEQAQGSHQTLDCRSDVYSLGVTLFECLTGRLPFTGTSSKILTQIAQADPLSPGKIRPGIPRDLETICLKAMAKEPAGRYASAGAMEEDLRRFSRYEPIRARRLGVVAHLLRWCRRDSKTALLISFLGIALLLGVGSVAALLYHIGRQTQARFDADLNDLERDLEFIDREEFAIAPRMDQARLQFLTKLAGKCQELTTNRSSSPKLIRRQAEVQSHLGTIYELLGKLDDAEKSYRNAILLSESLADDDPLPAGSDLLLARACQQLATLLFAVGRLDEADGLYQKALKTLHSTNGTSPPGHRAELAEILDKLGDLQGMTGRYDESEKNLRVALEWKQGLVSEFPSNGDWQYSLARTESQLSRLLTTLSRLEESEPLNNAAVNRLEKLVADARTTPAYQLGLAKAQGHYAQTLVAMGRTKESGQPLARAYQLFKKLADDYPHRPHYRLEMAAAQHDVARHPADHAANSTEQAKAVLEMVRLYRDAINEQERLAAELPALIENRRRLGVTLNTLATFQCDMGMYAVKEPVKAAELNAEAMELHRRSDAIWTKLAEDCPTVIAFQNGLARSDQRYGIILSRFGKVEQAEKGIRRSLAIQFELAKRFPKVISHHMFLCGLTHNLALYQDRRKNSEQAETLLREARNHAKDALAINPRFPVAKVQVSEATRDLSDLLLRLGKYREAAPLVREFGSSDYYTWWWHIEVFAYFRRCAQMASIDTSLSKEQRNELERLYGDWTMEQVFFFAKKIQGETQTIVSTLTFNPNLEHVRTRHDFQKLLAEMREAYRAS